MVVLVAVVLSVGRVDVVCCLLTNLFSVSNKGFPLSRFDPLTGEVILLTHHRHIEFEDLTGTLLVEMFIFGEFELVVV